MTDEKRFLERWKGTKKIRFNLGKFGREGEPPPRKSSPASPIGQRIRNVSPESNKSLGRQVACPGICSTSRFSAFQFDSSCGALRSRFDSIRLLGGLFVSICSFPFWFRFVSSFSFFSRFHFVLFAAVPCRVVVRRRFVLFQFSSDWSGLGLGLASIQCFCFISF